MLSPLYSDLTYKIRGAFFAVANNLGAGHKESTYERALCVEFNKAGIRFQEQKLLDVNYEGQKIGIYKPDFVLEDKIILEVKANEINFYRFEKQLIYYLKNTGYKLGFVVNFGVSPLVIKRKILDGSV